MKSTQMACLQKLVNALQECEAVGLTFSHSYLRLDVEDDESHYLENISSEKLSNLLNFIDGCGVFKSDEDSVQLDNPETADVYIGYDDSSRVGDHTAYVEFKNNVLTRIEIIE